MSAHQRALAVVNAGRAQTNARLVMAFTGRGGRQLKTKRLPFGSKRDRRNKQALDDAFAHNVQMLTNWQRHQWSRAGHPGLTDRDVSKVWPYLEAVRVDRQPVRTPPARRGNLVTRWIVARPNGLGEVAS